MNRLIASGILCVAFATFVNAETMTPQATVKHLIEAAHSNDLRGVLDASDLLLIGSNPRHAMTPNICINFLQSIDSSLLEFQQIKLGPLPYKTTIRVINPIQCDFDLELRTAKETRQEDYYVVTGIHP